MCLGDHIRTFTPQRVWAVHNNIHAEDGRMVDGHDGHWISKHFVYIVGGLPQSESWPSELLPAMLRQGLGHATSIGSTGFKLSKLHHLRVKRYFSQMWWGKVWCTIHSLHWQLTFRRNSIVIKVPLDHTIPPSTQSTQQSQDSWIHVKPTSCLNISWN